MSIDTLRLSLADIPGAHEMTMNYGRDAEGKEIQIFNIAGKAVPTSPMAGEAEIRAAILEATS